MIKKSRAFICMFLTIVLIFLSMLLIGCAEEADPCENKICIECGEDASHFASGVKPNGSNKNNSEQINSSIYRIFYCNICWNNIPKS